MFWCALGDRLYLSQDKSVLNEESWFWASESLKHIPKTMIHEYFFWDYFQAFPWLKNSGNHRDNGNSIHK